MSWFNVVKVSPQAGSRAPGKPHQGGVLCLWPAAQSLYGSSKSNGRSRACWLHWVPWNPEAPEAAGQWFLAKRKRSRAVWPGQLGIDEGDGDVAGSLGGGEPLVVVRESPRVHECPALPWGSDGAVVAQEPTAPTLEDRKCQFPNRKLGLPPCSPLLSHLSHRSQGALSTACLGCLWRDSYKRPKEDTKQRPSDREQWPCSQAALGNVRYTLY